MIKILIKLIKIFFIHNELNYKKLDYLFIASHSYIEYDNLFLSPINYCKEFLKFRFPEKINKVKITKEYLNLLG